MRERVFGRFISALRQVAAGTSLTLACGTTLAAGQSLQQRVNDLVDQGFEAPQRSLAALRALESAGQTASERRIVLTGIGLVAADNNLFDEARAAIRDLEALVPRAGELAHADALLVRSDAESSNEEPKRSVADAAAAVAAYAPFCDEALTDDTRACNSFDWFYANMFAGISANEAGSLSTSSIYLSSASEIARRAHRPDLEARAMAFMAKQAQLDGNIALSDRVLERAATLAAQSGETSAQEFVQIFVRDVLTQRGDYQGALAALDQAQRIARAAGHLRRLNDLALDRIELTLKLKHPADALDQISHVLPSASERHIDYRSDWLTSLRVIALVQLGRKAEAQRQLSTLLDAIDGRLGPVERSGLVDDVGDALLSAGDEDAAQALFEREREAVLAGGDKPFEHRMLDRQTELQHRQARQRQAELRLWGTAAGGVLLVLLALAAAIPWLRARNRRLELANDTLLERSERDPLTQLLNRDGLLRRLRERSSLEAFAGTLLLLDIDHFKKINDTLSHAGGDAVLREVAARVQACVRQEDLVARWGGEELVVAVLSTPFDADALVDRILHSFADAPVAFQEHRIAVTASMGYGAFPLDEPAAQLPFDTSLAVVDAGMYYAKRHGRRAAVRINALPASLLSDLGGLPDAVEREATRGAVRLSMRRSSERADSRFDEDTAEVVS